MADYRLTQAGLECHFVVHGSLGQAIRWSSIVAHAIDQIRVNIRCLSRDKIKGLPE